MPAAMMGEMMKGKYRILTLYFMSIAWFGCSSTPALANNTGYSCPSLTAGLVKQWSAYTDLSRKEFTDKTGGYKIEYMTFSGRNEVLESEIQFIDNHNNPRKTYRILSRAVSAGITSNNKYAVTLLLKTIDGLAQHLVRASQMSPFQVVSKCNNIGMLKLLLRNDVDMYAQTRGKYRYDALWESVVPSNVEVSRYLLENGFNPCRNYWIKNLKGGYSNRYEVAKQSKLPKALLPRLKCSAYSKNEQSSHD